MILYDQLASWWPLFSPPVHYIEEAADLIPRLQAAPDSPPKSLLELGSGGGSLASHLKHHFQLTLTDLSPGMLAVSRVVNPECEHLEGDMRSLRLGRLFDLVLIHDAVMYLTEPEDLESALRTAAVHCRPGGAVIVLPDHVRENFESRTDWGGEDGPDGRGLRFLEWCHDPDPSDQTYAVDYAIVLRSADGSTQVTHDRHIEGLFTKSQWLEWLDRAGFDATSVTDPWRAAVFIGRRRPDA